MAISLAWTIRLPMFKASVQMPISEGITLFHHHSKLGRYTLRRCHHTGIGRIRMSSVGTGTLLVVMVILSLNAAPFQVSTLGTLRSTTKESFKCMKNQKVVRAVYASDKSAHFVCIRGKQDAAFRYSNYSRIFCRPGPCSRSHFRWTSEELCFSEAQVLGE